VCHVSESAMNTSWDQVLSPNPGHELTFAALIQSHRFQNYVLVCRLSDADARRRWSVFR